MKNSNWMDDIICLDAPMPKEPMDNQTIYTLTMKDFLAMPDINYESLKKVDANIKALFN